MDKKVIEKIKKDLSIRKKQIEDELNDVAQKGKKDKLKTKFPEYGNKTDENAREIDEYSTNLATKKILENILRDINNTLGRIAKGTYGICKYCRKEMEKKRLLARPVASACIECKTKLQKTV